MAQRGSLATRTSAHPQKMHLEELQSSRTGHSTPAGLLDKAGPHPNQGELDPRLRWEIWVKALESLKFFSLRPLWGSQVAHPSLLIAGTLILMNEDAEPSRQDTHTHAHVLRSPPTPLPAWGRAEPARRGRAYRTLQHTPA